MVLRVEKKVSFTDPMYASALMEFRVSAYHLCKLWEEEPNADFLVIDALVCKSFWDWAVNNVDKLIEAARNGVDAAVWALKLIRSLRPDLFKQ